MRIRFKRLALLLAGAAAAAPLQAAPPTARKPLAEVGRYYGFPTVQRLGRAFTLESRFTTLDFYKDSRKLYYNGLLIWLNAGVLQRGAALTVTEADARLVLDPLLRTELTLQDCNIAVVVLDAGHGGADSGAIGSRRNVWEKKVTLDLARRARAKLEAAGIGVRLTRSEDRALSLARRTRLAKRWGADLFVSIHLNSSGSTAASGIETFVLPAEDFPSTQGSAAPGRPCLGNRYDAENTILAYYLQRALLKKTGGLDRGIKRARFHVLCNAPCPAALVECGFLSNPAEEAGMLRSTHRDRIADGISEGILRYIGKCGK